MERESLHAENVGAAAGGLAGGAAGFVAGAQGGTLVLPGWGTAVGGVVGAIGGSVAGEKLTSEVSRQAVEYAQAGGTTVKDATIEVVASSEQLTAALPALAESYMTETAVATSETVTGLRIIASDTADYLWENAGPAVESLGKRTQRSAGASWRYVSTNLTNWIK